MISRRSVLKFGAAGGLLLALAGASRAEGRYRPASGREPPEALGSDDRAVVAAIAPAILAGTGGAGANVEAVVGSVDRAVAGLPPYLRDEVSQLFALLASWPGRRWVAGVASPWPEASVAEVQAFLERWRFSEWALLQQGYQALHELVLAAWYARPDAWAQIGYPGPPEVR